MKFEYTGWDDYVNLKRTDEQYQQIKKDWKRAINDYFGITIPPEDERTPTVAHMKQIEFQVSKLRNDIYTIHTRINQITDCGHGKLKQMVTPLHQANVIGRIEALEKWRSEIAKPDIIQLGKRVRELEDIVNTVHKYTNQDRIDIRKLQEWREKLDGIDETKYKVIRKKVWDEIKHLVKQVDNYSWPEKNLEYGNLRACIYRLKEEIKGIDGEFEFD